MLGLRTTIYKVSQLTEATEWYTKAFHTEPYFIEVFYVGFNIKGYELGLLPEEDSSYEKTDNILAYWGVEKIRKTYSRLLEMGATSHEAPKNVGGDIEVASVRDPWNNVIGLIYNPEFKLED